MPGGLLICLCNFRTYDGEAFLKTLPRQFRARYSDMFATEKVQANRWLVAIQGKVAFAELRNIAEAFRATGKFMEQEIILDE